MRSMKPSTFYQVKGFPGLKNMAPYIQPLIPSSKVYVEPFAGLARTCEVHKHDKIVLNDLSSHALDFLKTNFPQALVTSDDYLTCIRKWDSPEAFFLIDPPWRANIYENNDGPVLTSKPRHYYRKLLDDVLDKLAGDWIVCSDAAEVEINKALSRSRYPNKVLRHPTMKLFGRPISVRMISNLWEEK